MADDDLDPGRVDVPTGTRLRRLDGRVALVTGGSRGLGLAMCSALAAAGAAVAVNYGRSEEDARRAVARITDEGGTAAAVQGDVTDEDDAGRAVAEAADRLGGPVGIVVNNAARSGAGSVLESSTWEEYVGQLTFAVKAPLVLARAAVPGMKERRWGRIVNIGSEVAAAPAGGGAYVTAKMAVVGFTRAMAAELGGDGITVNVVAPGFIPVERHADIGDDDRAVYTQSVPLARMGVPAEIGETVAFLTSDAGGFITGQTIVVNGGRTFCV